MKAVTAILTAWLVFTSATSHASILDLQQISATAPKGFTVQALEPTGGKILKPDGWFYSEQHNSNSYTWVLSKEDTKKGPYDTGMKVQVLIGIQKGTSKTPKDFVQSFINDKKANVKVITEFPESKQGLFQRLGLEVEETIQIAGKQKLFHIIYSLFWGDGMDLVGVTVAGTTPDLWSKYAEVFNTMSPVEIIDMKRFIKTEPVSPSITTHPQ